MAIFGGSGKQDASAGSQSVRGGAPGVASLSIVGLGMTVTGDIETSGVVKVEGTVHGHVIAGQQVLVAKGGTIEGEVNTGEAVVGGTVHGAVTATLRVEVQAGATVHGDVTTKRITVADGAVLNGSIRMGGVEEAGTDAPAPSTERSGAGRTEGVKKVDTPTPALGS
jgi:cytoskeletal protein CcmA (bactofilin family)